MPNGKKGASNRYFISIIGTGGIFLAALALVLSYQPQDQECVKIKIFGQMIERCRMALADEGATGIADEGPNEESPLQPSLIQNGNSQNGIPTASTTSAEGNATSTSTFSIDGLWGINGTSSGYNITANAIFNSSMSNMTASQTLGQYEISGSIANSTIYNVGSFQFDAIGNTLALAPSDSDPTSYQIWNTRDNSFNASNQTSKEYYTFQRMK